MNLILKDAQRILDDCRENYLHPANNVHHPLHKETIRAITELEKIVFELTDIDKIKTPKRKKGGFKPFTDSVIPLSSGNNRQ